MSREPFSELLRRRRMVCSYLPDPIDHETVERIVGTVRCAPARKPLDELVRWERWETSRS